MPRIVALLASCVLLRAEQPPKKSQTVAGAHEHGTAALNIAVEGSSGTVEFEAPAEGIVGFEHEARTAAQKKQRDEALNTLRTRAGELVIFEPSRGCRLAVQRAEMVRHGGEGHSEISAEYSLSCSASLAGSAIRFGVTKLFPRVAAVDVQLVAPAGQTGAKIKSDQGAVTIPK